MAQFTSNTAHQPYYHGYEEAQETESGSQKMSIMKTAPTKPPMAMRAWMKALKLPKSILNRVTKTTEESDHRGTEDSQIVKEAGEGVTNERTDDHEEETGRLSPISIVWWGKLVTFVDAQGKFDVMVINQLEGKGHLRRLTVYII